MKKKTLLLVTISIFFTSLSPAWAVSEIDLYFPPEWGKKSGSAYIIADKLGQKVGIKINPRIAGCIPEILSALSEKRPVLSYVDSMVQTVVLSRKLGEPLLQALDQKEFYGGILVFPKGMSPSVILNYHPAEIAYTVGETSGEVCAKAATSGKASIASSSNRAAIYSLRSGKAKAAFVKNTWWDDIRHNYPEFDSYSVPGISDIENADNVLLASKFVSSEIKASILNATIKYPSIFNANLVVPFDSFYLWFTINLMKKAGIDPLSYAWPDDSGHCEDETDSRPLTSPGSLSTPKPPSPSKLASQSDQTYLAGEKLSEKHCSRCHLIEKVKKYRRKTREQWEETLSRKLAIGVELTMEERTELINYLLSLKKERK